MEEEARLVQPVITETWGLVTGPTHLFLGVIQKCPSKTFFPATEFACESVETFPIKVSTEDLIGSPFFCIFLFVI